MVETTRKPATSAKAISFFTVDHPFGAENPKTWPPESHRRAACTPTILWPDERFSTCVRAGSGAGLPVEAAPETPGDYFLSSFLGSSFLGSSFLGSSFL